MNTKSQISSWQLFSLLLLSRLLTTITFMPVLNLNIGNTDYIVSTVFGGVLSILFFIPSFIYIKKNRGITQISDGVSKKLTRLIAIIYALFFLMYIFSTLTRINLFVSAVVFPQRSTELFMVLSIAAACYAASHGLEALGRVGSVTMLFFILSFIVILFSLRERFDINNLSPALYDGIKPLGVLIWGTIMSTVEPAALMIVLPKVSGKLMKSFVIWIICFISIASLIFLFLMSTLGEAALLELFPFHSMAVLSQFGVFERMDALLIGTWIMSAFVKSSFLILIIADLLSENIKKLKRGTVIISMFLIISAVILAQSKSIMYFKANLSLILNSILFLLFVVVIPAALLIIDKLRNRGAKE